MNDSNLAALRQQWLDLQALHDKGALDTAGHETARLALEQRIVATVLDAPPATAAADSPVAPPTQPTPPAQRTPETPPVPAGVGNASVPMRLWGIAAAFVLLLAGAGYAWKGSPGAVGTPPPGFDQASAAGGAGSAPSGRPSGEQLDALVQRLVERLKKQPDDVEGWSMLGRSLMALGRFGDAAGAYAKAAALRPTDAGPLADQADALGVANGRTLEGEPARLIERALKLDAKHIKSLVLAGTRAFQGGDFATAERHWQTAVNVGPAGDGLVELAREGVTQARARAAAAGGAAPAAPPVAAAKPAAPAAPSRATAGVPSPAATPASASGAVAGRSISGTVRLAAALKDQAGPGDTVFIFARAAGGGGGMPLAIVQKRVADLPASFTLDDSQAMSPAARLSGAERVVITARISKSGQAMPQPGDLEGVSAAVAPGARDLAIEISNVRR